MSAKSHVACMLGPNLSPCSSVCVHRARHEAGKTLALQSAGHPFMSVLPLCQTDVRIFTWRQSFLLLHLPRAHLSLIGSTRRPRPQTPEAHHTKRTHLAPELIYRLSGSCATSASGSSTAGAIPLLIDVAQHAFWVISSTCCLRTMSVLLLR